MENIKNLIKRIGAEAETVEDMEQLLLSEIEALENLESFEFGDIKLYSESKIMGTDAIVGEVAGKYIALRQKIVNNELRSVYVRHK